MSVDVVGVGALNLDHIADARAMAGERGTAVRAEIARVLARAGISVRAGAEAWVGERTMQAVLDAAAPLGSTSTEPGGSACNAVRALARTGTGLRLGFVGVAGRSPVPGVDVLDELRALGVDTGHVRSEPGRICGVCFSYAEDGERTLLTHAGANSLVAGHLDASFEDLVAYLSRARIVHVACLVEDDGDGIADRLAGVLEAVRRSGGGTRISLDPGHGWSADAGPAVQRLLALSDYVLVNRQELRDLTGCEAGGEAAVRLLHRMAGDRPAVVVKQPDGVRVHRLAAGEAVSTRCPQEPLPAEEIRDATGAGDVFAAGLLAVLARHPEQLDLACRLGLAMARHKLRHTGSRGTAYDRVARAVLPGRGGDPLLDRSV